MKFSIKTLFLLILFVAIGLTMYKCLTHKVSFTFPAKALVERNNEVVEIDVWVVAKSQQPWWMIKDYMAVRWYNEKPNCPISDESTKIVWYKMDLLKGPNDEGALIWKSWSYKDDNKRFQEVNDKGKN